MLDLPPQINEHPQAMVQIVEKKANQNQSKVKSKAIVKIPKDAKNPELDTNPLTYNELIRSSKDEEVIAELITTMAEKGKIKLLFIKHHMEHLGDQVRHVHPLKFLGFIFSKPELKGHFKLILTDYFKKSNFIDGLAPALNNEVRTGKIKNYLDDFCKEVNVQQHQVQPYINRRDWEGMLHFLSNN